MTLTLLKHIDPDPPNGLKRIGNNRRCPASARAPSIGSTFMHIRRKTFSVSILARALATSSHHPPPQPPPRVRPRLKARRSQRNTCGRVQWGALHVHGRAAHHEHGIGSKLFPARRRDAPACARHASSETDVAGLFTAAAKRKSGRGGTAALTVESTGTNSTYPSSSGNEARFLSHNPQLIHADPLNVKTVKPHP